MAQGQQEENDDKPHEASERKIRKAREKGDVPSSKEAGTFMSVFALGMISVFLAQVAFSGLGGVFLGVISKAGGLDLGQGEAGVADLSEMMYAFALDVGILIGPAFVMLIVCALAAVALQGHVVFAVDRIQPKLSKISPKEGFKRIFSGSAMIEFLKSILKVMIVGTFGVWFAWRAVTGIWAADMFLPESILSVALAALVQMLVATICFLVVIAGADILWQRAKWHKKQRMSEKEVRDENKESEGDPLLKSRRRRIQMEKSRQRIATAVPLANVILTNPTHYAVALRYVQGEDLAPVCVAKGTDLMAAQIRRIARENGIPIVENRPLARALHAVAELDRAIPMDHWPAVAEIIGFIFDIQQRRFRKPPPGSTLRVDED
jgi:flagellar biosynthesis protein FlhB